MVKIFDVTTEIINYEPTNSLTISVRGFVSLVISFVSSKLLFVFKKVSP